MKKIYSKPNALPEEVLTEQMIAVSTFEQEADPNGEVLSRRGDRWGTRRSEWVEDNEDSW